MLNGFDAFLGTGTVDFNFASTKTFTITPSAGTLSLLAQVGGAATLTYNYSLPVTPPTNDVPEPSSWALLLIGFGGMGALIRRRRTSVAFG